VKRRVIALAAPLAATMMLTACYEGVPGGTYGMYRVNRITGTVLFCSGAQCWTAEEKPKPDQAPK
jgi:hypothetical protein